jgi:hypothetical protein
LRGERAGEFADLNCCKGKGQLQVGEEKEDVRRDRPLAASFLFIRSTMKDFLAYYFLGDALGSLILLH